MDIESEGVSKVSLERLEFIHSRAQNGSVVGSCGCVGGISGKWNRRGG